MILSMFVIIFLSIITSIGQCNQEIHPVERLCNDHRCRKPISLAEPKVAYTTSRRGGASFVPGDKVFIYSKPVPEEKNGLYEVEVYDKSEKKLKSKGLVPPNFLKEVRLFVKKDSLQRVNRASKTIAPINPTEELSTDATSSNNFNITSVINSSPVGESHPPQDVTSTGAVPVSETQAYIAGGVNAELGDGGNPSTPYTVVDGTTFTYGIDGEESIHTTPTQPPALNTEKSPTPTQSYTVQPADTLSEEDENEENEEDEGYEEGDDESEENEEETEEEESSEQVPENINNSKESDQPLKTEKLESSPIPADPLSVRNKRELPSDPQVMRESLKEINKNLEEQLNSEPGKSTEADEGVLRAMQIAKAQPVVAPPSRSPVGNDKPQHGADNGSPQPYIAGKTEQVVGANNMQGMPVPVNQPRPSDPIFDSSATLPGEATWVVGQITAPQNVGEASTIETDQQGAPTASQTAPLPIVEQASTIDSYTQEAPTPTPQQVDGQTTAPQNLDMASAINTNTPQEFRGTTMPEEPASKHIPDFGQGAPDKLGTTSDPQVAIEPDQNAHDASISKPDALQSNLGGAHDSLEEIAVAQGEETANQKSPDNVNDGGSGHETPSDLPETVETAKTVDNIENTFNSIQDHGLQGDATNSNKANQVLNENSELLSEYENDTVINTSEYSQQSSQPEPSDALLKDELINITENDDSFVPTQVETDGNQVPSAGSPTGNYVYEALHHGSPPPPVGGMPKFPRQNTPPPMYPGLLANKQIVVEGSAPLATVEEVKQEPQAPETRKSGGMPDLPTEAPNYQDSFNIVPDSQDINTASVSPSYGETIETPPVEVVPSPEETLSVPSMEIPAAVDDIESPGWFSGIFSGLFGSTPQQPTTDDVMLTPTDPVASTKQSALVQSDDLLGGECKTISGLESDCADAPGPDHLWHVFEKTVPEKSYSLLYLIVTSVTLLIFTLGYYFIEGSRQNGPLIAKINQLTNDLQVATSQLEARPIQGSTSISEDSEIVNSLQKQIAEAQKRNGELQLQVDALQNELDSSADAGMELNKMVTDLLADKQADNALLQSMERLQGQLDAQEKVMGEMNARLLEKDEENKNLQAELSSIQERSEEELNSLRENLTQHLKEKENAVWELERKCEQLEFSNSELLAEIDELKEGKTAEVTSLTKSLAELKKQLTLKESEYTALNDTIEELKRGGLDAAAVYDVGHIKAKLSRVITDRDALQERLRDEEGSRKFLEDHNQSMEEEVQKLRTSIELAKKEKVEAETKLDVLSNYWKETETRFQKELGLSEAMWAQKQGDDTTAYDRIKSLQDEVENYNLDSFQTSNEGISMNSFSSNSIDAFSSSASNFPSVSSKQHDVASSPEPSPSVCSLPVQPTPKPRLLVRRKSSASFEARMERVHLMMKPASSTKIIPDDLLKLQELKTVRASPFRSSSPPSTRNSLVSLPDIGDDIPKCSDLIVRFENVNSFPSTKVNPSSKLDDNDSLNCFSPDGFKEPFFDKKFPTEPLPFDFNDSVSYTLNRPAVFDLPLIPLPSPRRSHSPAPKSPVKSESEDSQSINKDCELTSSATLEFDIKVVANASSNIKKFKMKTTKPKDGSQNESLKKEILDQERGLKSQIATLEKKAHENWVAARQAERRLDESKHEAGQLRNKLTMMEKTNGADVVPRLPGDVSGDDGSLPPILPDGTSPLPLPPLPFDPHIGLPPMFPPNFMPPFMPPPMMPPPHMLSGDRRLPPLGRMSSPPLNRFSPGPGDYGYDRMSPTPHSPPPRKYRSPPTHRSSPWDELPPPRGGFRPVASHRDSRREYTDSNLSSGHSSEDSGDKPPPPPTRRGKK